MPLLLRFIYLIILSLLLASCAFDNDISRVPYTDAVFLLVKDSIEGGKQIFKIRGGNLDYHWEEKAGIGKNELGDMSGDEMHIWISSSNQKLYKILAETEQIEEIITLENIQPDFICLGDHNLLIADSTHKSLSFLNLKSLNISTYQLDGSPREARYRSGKFYLIYNQNSLQIYLDQSHSLLSELTFDYLLKDVQADARNSIFVYTEGNGEVFETKIDYHSDQIVNPETSVFFNKIRFSPFTNQTLGKELLLNIKRVDKELRLANKPNCSDFELDFLESIAYYQNGDSLFMMNALKNEISGLGIFRGNFQKSYFRVQY